MSTALAIASVTAVLKDLLQNGVIDHDLTSSVGDVLVSALPPDRVDISEATGKSQLNLFLYQATQNAAWRNTALPSRDSEGNLLTNQPLALDLHYLLTAYGLKDLHSEILLGYGMQLLHDTPVLARAAIRRALAPPSPIGDGGLPPELRALFDSELAEQFEQIRITPETLSTEEVSKLWSAFQARYRPTAAYVASVVLIEGRRATRPSLPVRTRKIYAVPFRQPVIERIQSQAADNAPVASDQPILAGHNLVLAGRGLRGDLTFARVGGVDVELDPARVEDTRVTFALPAGLRAGAQGVQVIHRALMGSPPEPHAGAESNLAAFVLRPRVVSQGATVTGSAGGFLSGTIGLTVEPAVGAGQRVRVLLNEINAPVSRPPRAYGFDAPPAFQLSPPSSPPDATNDLFVPFVGVAAGEYLLRVQVDGAESPLERDGEGRFVSPRVVIA